MVTFYTTKGVPQGAVLSPLLFNIYTSHLLTKMNPEISLAAYSDDVALYFSQPNPNYAVYKIERALTQLAQYNVSINPDKEDGLIFSYHLNFKRPTYFRLGNRQIAFSNNITHMGITFDKNLTYSCHLKRKIDTLKTIKITL